MISPKTKKKKTKMTDDREAYRYALTHLDKELFDDIFTEIMSTPKLNYDRLNKESEEITDRMMKS